MLTAAEGGGPLAGLGSRMGPVGLGVQEPGWGMELAMTLVVPRRGGSPAERVWVVGQGLLRPLGVLKGSALQEGA